MTVKQAASLYAKGDAFRFDFALSAAEVVGKRDGGTELLAQACRLSVDRIEDFAECGRFITWAHRQYPSDSERMRESLPFAFWVAVSDCERGWGSVEAWEYLLEASETQTDIRTFRAQLPKKPVPPEKQMEKDIKALSRMREYAGSLMDAMNTSPEQIVFLLEAMQGMSVAEKALTKAQKGMMR